MFIQYLHSHLQGFDKLKLANLVQIVNLFWLDSVGTKCKGFINFNADINICTQTYRYALCGMQISLSVCDHFDAQGTYILIG